MTMPGFSADASLYRTESHYHRPGVATSTASGGAYPAAINPWSVCGRMALLCESHGGIFVSSGPCYSFRGVEIPCKTCGTCYSFAELGPILASLDR
jgi:hypothetical protein